MAVFEHFKTRIYSRVQSPRTTKISFVTIPGLYCIMGPVRPRHLATLDRPNRPGSTALALCPGL
ncbi:hypothetical protein J6590_039506 [Homalodisca vitripennis]|nr:hypothetical protein J6590_039506 [Homalodisca vitripennis]